MVDPKYKTMKNPNKKGKAKIIDFFNFFTTFITYIFIQKFKYSSK